MENRAELGMNRTGMQAAPVQNDRMKQNTELTQPTSAGDESALAEVRGPYIREADALGSVPPPGTLKGVVASGIKMVKGQRPHAFLDKLGERLAFERMGTRLYEALIMKCEAVGDAASAPPLERLREFCADEAAHFALLVECIAQLGADPTAQTPCADLAGVESMGLMQVITDPRTNVTQSLHAVLVGELTDNAGWDELIALAREIGQPEMASRFEQAAATEALHLEHIRRWHEEATLRELRMVAH